MTYVGKGKKIVKWTDTGIVISTRPFSEHNQIITILTQTHGRCAGLMRVSRTKGGQQQPGNQVQASWQARLSEHLGKWTLETTMTPAARFMMHPHKLACLMDVCHLVETQLPERHPYAIVYEALMHLIELLVSDDPYWQKFHVYFHVLLLREIGFGLDLSCCAATGQTDDLIYVSPKTARAVSREAGAPYHDKLLVLPAFLLDETREPCVDEIEQGLKLTRYFFNLSSCDGKVSS